MGEVYQMSLLKEIEPIKTKDYLKEKFREYYKSAKITLPPRFTTREWGFLNWGGGVMNRHVKFGSINEVKNYLKKVAPAHSYHSVAYYKEPGSKTMVEKKWQGADLIFDLDADHLPEMEEVKKGQITFSKLMEYIREQTFRLVHDVLLRDFGLDEKDLLITFSGGRGYHVHVRTPAVLSLPSGARRELSDYMTGKGLNLDNILIDAGYTKEFAIRGKGLERKNLGVKKLPEIDAKGWSGIISRKINSMFDELRQHKGKDLEKKLKEKNIEKAMINFKEENREIFNSLSKRYQKNLVRNAVKEAAIFPDEPVTGDVHRLIRLPGSLHGGSGLRVTTISSKELENFDPMKSAIAFGEKPIKIRSVVEHPVSMGDIAKLMPKTVVEVPEKAAIYFMARKWANLVLET
tara:strand:- start:1758 stop:2969 length:1212 start_codon:yes stop_codon:yes gene_type:complete